MRRRRVLVGAVALVIGAAIGCNRNGNVSDPSGIREPEPVIVLSGRTLQPVPSLSGMTARRGQELHLQAPGFFALHTAYAGAPVLLWPADDGFLTSRHTRHLVYRGDDPGTLHRLPRGVTSVSLVPDDRIRASPWALARVTKAAGTLSLSHDALDFAVDGAGFRVDLVIDVTDQVFRDNLDAAAAAYTHNEDDGTITKARVVFRTLQIAGFWYTEDNFETAVVHEVIHTTGLYHSSSKEDPPGIMMDSAESYSFRAPSEHERLIMKLQYERLPGTVLVGMSESDPGVSGRSVRRGWHLVCVR